MKKRKKRKKDMSWTELYIETSKRFRKRHPPNKKYSDIEKRLIGSRLGILDLLGCYAKAEMFDKMFKEK